MRRGAKADAIHYDTIIIGAGMSGLACAARLLEHPSYQNGKSLLVLEARNRIGGRIESVRVKGNRLDTGANWCHGVGSKENPNPLIGILPEKRVKELSSSVAFRPPSTKTDPTLSKIVESDAEDWVQVDTQCYSTQPSNGDLVIPSDISGNIFGTRWSLVGSLHEIAANTSPEDAFQTSMLAAIGQDEAFKAAFHDVPAKYHQTLRALPQFLEDMEAAPLHQKSAEHRADHPGMGLSEFSIDDFEGAQVFLRDGYTAVVEKVGQIVVENGHVKLGVEVDHVLWESGPVTLDTSDGTYTANRVVCTLPLGVLQSHMVSSPEVTPFFVPMLPPEKAEAIKSLGFGTLDKIFLAYERPWWRDEPYNSILKKGLVNHSKQTADYGGDLEPDSMRGFTEELPGLEIAPDGSVGPGPRVLSVINLHSLTGFPILSSFVSCANAVHVEGLSDHAAGMIVHRSLKKWFGLEPPLPDAVHVTRWSSDPYSLGSYSHMITNLSKRSHREAFQTPIINRDGSEIRFAGEHTSSDSFATVHGALLSGWREADSIIEHEARAESSKIVLTTD